MWEGGADMNDRIKLAETMGWERQAGEFDLKSDPDVWIGPDTKQGDFGNYFDFDELPDPFTDANDCEALIRWLCSNGHSVRVDFLECFDEPESSTVSLDGDESGDDCRFWKQGVCELALKVIE